MKKASFHQVAVLGGATVAALLIIHAPGIAIALIREVCRLNQITQHVADFFACAIATVIAIVAGRFVRSQKRGQTVGINGTATALGLGICAALACRSVVVIAQSGEFLFEQGVVKTFGALSLSSMVTGITRFGIQSSVFEEAAIRGYLHFRVAAVWGPWFAIFYGALITVAIHAGTDGFVFNIPFYLVMGIILGWLVQVTRSLVVVVVFHLVFNVSGLLIEVLASTEFAPGVSLSLALSKLFPTEILVFVFSVSAAIAAKILHSAVGREIRI